MGSFRSQPDKNKHTAIKQFKNINATYAVSHMCGWRLYMQDACISLSPFPKTDKESQMALFGVFDGHGGAEVSTFVERHFPEELQNNQAFKKGDYEVALKETFLQMDVLLRTDRGKDEVRQIQKEMKEMQNGPNQQEQSHAGCTANVILITKDFIYVANAGDSRSVACVSGTCKPLSYDHKPEEKVEIERIEKAGGTVSFGRVNGNLNLSRALGDLQYKQNSNIKPQEQIITANPDVTKIPNQNIDFIIMGCDGIWQVKSNAEMVEWVSKRMQQKRGLGEILEELLDELLAKDQGGQYGMDNMSAILIKFGENGNGSKVKK